MVKYMVKMLIIADDFTGAMDTGVKLAASGISTKVTMDLSLALSPGDPTEVLAVCAPTRHLPPEEAYRVIRGVTERAKARNIPYIFKKTDSALRGNIGAELTAVLDGSGGDRLHFLPALPSMNRITRDGTHYIDGLTVSESVFGKDPFEPVTESYVPAMIAAQSDTAVFPVKRNVTPDFSAGEKGIYVFDAESDQDLRTQVRMLKERGELRLMAGCAALASILPEELDFHSSKEAVAEEGPDLMNGLTVICGSVNRISLKQLDHAEKTGSVRIHLLPEKLLASEETASGLILFAAEETCRIRSTGQSVLIDTISPDAPEVSGDLSCASSLEWMRQTISDRLGALTKILMDQESSGPIMIIGGDTLLSILNATGMKELIPVRELFPGVVFFRVTYLGRQYEMISKSGGFGCENLITDMREMQRSICP